MVVIVEIESNILYKDFLGENAYPIPLLELYSSFDEYEEITMPWLFEETFEEVNRNSIFTIHLSFYEIFLAIDQTKCKIK